MFNLILKYLAIIVISITTFCFIILLTTKTPFWISFLLLFFGGLIGIVLLGQYKILERLDALEYKEPVQKDTENVIQSVVCEKCGSSYELDYPKCPNCGMKNRYL